MIGEMFIHDTVHFDSCNFLQSPRRDSLELRESILLWLNVWCLVDIFLSFLVSVNMMSYFFLISFILFFFFQGIRGPVGLPGPVGLKGEQVHKIKIVVCLLIA